MTSTVFTVLLIMVRGLPLWQGAKAGVCKNPSEAECNSQNLTHRVELCSGFQGLPRRIHVRCGRVLGHLERGWSA